MSEYLTPEQVEDWIDLEGHDSPTYAATLREYVAIVEELYRLMPEDEGLDPLEQSAWPEFFAVWLRARKVRGYE